jgi:hypothetical protein
MSEKCIFVGYPRETLGYTFYHPTEGKTFVAKTGIFLEKEFLAKGVGGRKVELDEIVDPHSKYRVAQRKRFLVRPLSKRKKGRLM